MEQKDQKSMTDSALDVQRYELGLMTPDEAVAFEHGLSKSPDHRKEFDEANEALTALYEKLSAAMPAPVGVPSSAA